MSKVKEGTWLFLIDPEGAGNIRAISEDPDRLNIQHMLRDGECIFEVDKELGYNEAHRLADLKAVELAKSRQWKEELNKEVV